MSPELAPDPIVVYGSPRSGTSYLQRILNAHPEVCITHETRVFEWLYQAVAFADDDRFVYNHRQEFTTHLRTFLPEMMRGFYRELAPEAKYWGDKNPHYAEPDNIRALDLVAELFPGSKFVHIIRDGRDVVASLVRKQEDGKAWVSFDDAHATWKWHVHYGRLFGGRVGSERYFEFRYEDLVADDPAMAERIFDFLGIDYHGDVDAFCRAQHANRSPFQDPTRDLSRGARTSDWPDLFSPEERARSLELIGEDLTWYGYETPASLARLREELATASGTRAGAAD